MSSSFVGDHSAPLVRRLLELEWQREHASDRHPLGEWRANDSNADAVENNQEQCAYINESTIDNKVHDKLCGELYRFAGALGLRKIK